MASNRIEFYDRARKQVVPLVTGGDPIHDSKGSPWPGIKLEHFQVENLHTPEVSTDCFLRRSACAPILRLHSGLRATA